MFYDMPPNQAIVSKVDDKKYADEQLRRRRKETEERKEGPCGRVSPEGG